jgi:hypothetical protein
MQGVPPTPLVPRRACREPNLLHFGGLGGRGAPSCQGLPLVAPRETPSSGRGRQSKVASRGTKGTRESIPDGSQDPFGIFSPGQGHTSRVIPRADLGSKVLIRSHHARGFPSIVNSLPQLFRKSPSLSTSYHKQLVGRCCDQTPNIPFR